MKHVVGAGIFVALLAVAAAVLSPTGAKAAACPAGQVPDDNDNCCPPTSLMGPPGVSLCPGSTLTTEVLGKKLVRGIFNMPYHGSGAGYMANFQNIGGGNDDPYGSYSAIKINPVTVTNSTGAQSLGAGSTTTSLDAGADAHIDASKMFQVKGDNQILSIGAYLDYSSIQTNYDALAAGSSMQRNLYTAGATVTYVYKTSYFQGKFGGLWGNGTTSDGGVFGNFDTSGYEASLTAGHVFTLFDARTFATRKMPVKAPVAPQPVSGYLIGLDVNGAIGTYSEQHGAFTDTSGFINGAERLQVWNVDARARLFADIMNNGYVWTPYAAISVEQEVSFSHTLDLVAQAGQTADTLFFAAPGQTYGGFQTGLSVLDPKGIRYGFDASYLKSSGLESVGGRVYVRFPVMRWLGIAG
jgi:hypothetical protein